MSDEMTLPFDTQLEEHVIGCMVFDPNCIGELIEFGLKPKQFYHVGNSKFCEHLYSVWQDDPKKVDLSLLTPALGKFGYTVSRLMEVVSSIPTAANVTYYAEQIRTLAVLRTAVKVGASLQAARGLRDPEEIRETIGRAEEMIGKLNESQVKLDTLHSMKDALMGYHDELEKRYNAAGTTGVSGLASGFHDLDMMTAGFQDSDLIIVAARPSVGKTAFALNVAKNISLKYDAELKSTVPGEAGAIFSLEMPAKQLVGRMVSSEAKIDQRNLTSGMMVADDWEKYTMALSRLSDMNLVIDDGAGQTVADIKAKARKIRRERGLKYIIVDYLGMITGQRGMSRYDVVSENVRELKNLAKELNIPVIVLCQLSRSVEQRQDKRPMLSDLRESGEIEQTADVVAFLYRDDYYDKGTDKKNVVEVIIAKQRNGPVGTVELVFNKKYGRFSDLYVGGRTIGEQGTQVEAAI